MILNQIYGFQLISNFALGETMITSAEEIIKVQKGEPEIRYIYKSWHNVDKHLSYIVLNILHSHIVDLSCDFFLLYKYDTVPLR